MADRNVPTKGQGERPTDKVERTNKRRRKSSFTHRKLGTKGGRLRKSNESTVNGDISGHAYQPPVSSSDAKTILNCSGSLANTVVQSPPDARNFDSICSPTCTTETLIKMEEELEAIINDLQVQGSESLQHQSTYDTASLLKGPLNFVDCHQLVDQTSQENQADTRIHVHYVADVVAELQRRIFLPWIIVPEEEGIYVLLLSRDRAKTTQRSVYFSFSGKEELNVHCKEIPETIAKDILDKGDKSSNIVLSECSKEEFVDRIVTVVQRFRAYEVCVGVDNVEYKPLWLSDKNGKIDENPYHELRYSQTFRPFACEILVTTQKYFKRRCQTCINNKVRFHNKLPKHSGKEAPPTTGNIYLDRDQLVGKVVRQQKELQYARAQIVKLKAKF